jgi:FkbM family methyltransferase
MGYRNLMYSGILSRAKSKVIWFFKYVIGRLGVGITSYANLVNLQKLASDSSRQDLEFVQAFSSVNYEWMIPLLSKSKSQLRQDLFVLSETEKKREGYFVEFGATNGIDLSNTYLLETEFSWTGILAEPARVWHKKLRANRPNALIETLCVWYDSNSRLTFNEVSKSEFSTVDGYSDKDLHKDIRKVGKKYEVRTISLNELLIKHKSPKYIDYLSVDTEGSEYDILKALNFDEFKFGVITIEHNYAPQRELIFDLLTNHGYKRKFENISLFDDWYVKV